MATNISFQIKNQQDYKKPAQTRGHANNLEHYGGIALGTGSTLVARQLVKPADKLYLNKVINSMLNLEKYIKPKEIETLSARMIKENRLDKVGIRIIRDSSTASKIRSEQLEKFIMETFKKKRVDVMLAGLLTEMAVLFNTLFKASPIPISKKSTIDLSKNSFYSKYGNFVAIDKLKGSIFHELGHATNAHKSVLSKLPLKVQPFGAVAASFMLAISATYNPYKKKKAKSKFSQKIDSLKSFINKNIGMLSFAALSPVLIEEAQASIRAHKFLSKQPNVSKAAKNAHSKALAIAFSTYIVGTTLEASLAKLAVSVKDRFLKYRANKT